MAVADSLPEPIDVGAMIVKTPGTVGGRPRIDGTRMPVHAIASHHIHEGLNAEQIREQIFDHLDLVQIYAALAYFYANRAEIEDIWAEEEWFFEEFVKAYPSHSMGPNDDRAPFDAILDASRHHPWRSSSSETSA